MGQPIIEEVLAVVEILEVLAFLLLLPILIFCAAFMFALLGVFGIGLLIAVPALAWMFLTA